MKHTNGGNVHETNTETDNNEETVKNPPAVRTKGCEPST